MRSSRSIRPCRRARSIATAAKFPSAVRRSRSSAVNVPVLSGVSTWSAPMTRSRSQSGTHIADRICWMRIDWPASKRSSASASDVRTATRSRTTASTIVCEKVASGSGPSRPRRRASVGVGRPSSSSRTTTARSAGRKSKRRSTTFERICPTSRASIRVRADMTMASKIFSRVAGRRPASVPARSSLTFAGAGASKPKSRLKSAMDLTNVALESLIVSPPTAPGTSAAPAR